jgi:isoquinoline 1-oxidoreductase subunit beta
VGLALCVRPYGVDAAAEVAKFGADAMPGGTVDNPLVFVSISRDGTVTITVHRPEIGQGIRTTFAVVVSDELEADWNRVLVVQAQADEAKYGSQNTDGSRSMRHFFEPLRRVGAAARMMLEAAAAASWGVPVNEVEAQHHEVIHPSSGRHLTYGALAAGAMRQPIPPRERVRLKERSVIMGLSLAMTGEITFKAGRPQQSNFP